MKGKLLGILLAMLMIASVFALTSCDAIIESLLGGGGGGGNEIITGIHHHEWSEWELTANADNCEDDVYSRSCSGCDEVETKKGSHNYSEKLSCDETYHWQECLVCNNTNSKEKHKYENSTCTLCEYDKNSTTGIIYVISDDGTYAYVNGYEGTATDVVIANTYCNLPVIYIKKMKSVNISSITIPENVIEIEDNAFSGCENLEKITLHDNILSIDSSSFSDTAYYNNVENWENDVLYISKYLIDAKSTISDEYTIKNGTLVIAGGAFQYCKSLTSIVIPNSVHKIGYGAFRECDNLNNVVCGDGVTAIASYAFENCSNLSNIILPNNNIQIGPGAFYGTEYYKNSNNWKGSVLYIGNHLIVAKTYASGAIKIEDGTLSIANYAFDQCGSITNITIPDSITYIGIAVFRWCHGLTSVVIPNSVTAIGMEAFYGCDSLTSITIPDSVTSIGDKAFDGCTSLASITIPDNVVSIGNYAFGDCSSLTNIAIPDGVTTIGDGAFSRCDRLTNINVDKNNQYYQSIDGNLYTKDGKTLIQYAVGKNDISFVIPDIVTSIGSGAFNGCDSLTSVVIGDSVTSIGSGAFYGCSSLYVVYNNSDLSLKIGSDNNGDVAYYAKILVNNGETIYRNDGYNYTLTDDGFLFREKYSEYELIAYAGGEDTVTLPENINGNSYGFYYMRGVVNVIIPEGFTTINDYAFYGCSRLESVTIPDSVTSIGSYAFDDCDSLTSVYINDLSNWCNISFSNSFSNPLYYADNLYVNGELVTELVIPDDVTIIKSYAFCYFDSITSVVIPDSVTTIGSQAFYNCDSLVSVTIPDSVTTIDSYAFYNCDSLVSVTIPDSVTSIGDDAFYSCDSLVSVVIGDSVTSIGRYAFYGCSSLTSVVIPDSVTSIGSYAFAYCYNLTSVVIGNSVTIIDWYAFYNCSSLTSVTIPDSVTIIGSYAFAYCYNLTSVVIPDSVTSIVFCAFRGCDSLVSVTIPDSVTSIGDYAFNDCDSLTSVYINDLSNWCNISFSNYYSNPLFYADNLYVNGELVTELVIPDDVTIIKSYAFCHFDSITSVVIPDSVTTIGSSAFPGCSSLTEVYYNGSAAEWNSISIYSYGNDYLKNATRYYYSESEPTEEGNFWHWVNGEPTVWQ